MFFESTPPGGGFLQRRQTIDIVLNNIVWVFDRESDLVEALKNFQKGNFVAQASRVIGSILFEFVGQLQNLMSNKRMQKQKGNGTAYLTSTCNIFSLPINPTN